MSVIDELLDKFGLSYDDLNDLEEDTLNLWRNDLASSSLTVDKIKTYLSSMREAVENELAKSDLGTKQDIFLKARLRNYILLEAYLTSPERIKEQMASVLSGIAKKVK